MHKVDIDDLITIQDVMDIFEVKSEPTIHRWRKERDMEQHVIYIPSQGRPAVRYSYKGILKWAKVHDVPTEGLESWKKNKGL